MKISFLRVLLVIIILVSLSSLAGIYFFSLDKAETNRQLIIEEMKYLEKEAQNYYSKENSTYGGNSFLGWKIPEKLVSSKVGYYIADVQSQSISLTGTGFEIGNDGKNKVSVRRVINSASEVSTVILN